MLLGFAKLYGNRKKSVKKPSCANTTHPLHKALIHYSQKNTPEKSLINLLTIQLASSSSVLICGILVFVCQSFQRLNKGNFL